MYGKQLLRRFSSAVGKSKSTFFFKMMHNTNPTQSSPERWWLTPSFLILTSFQSVFPECLTYSILVHPKFPQGTVAGAYKEAVATRPDQDALRFDSQNINWTIQEFDVSLS